MKLMSIPLRLRTDAFNRVIDSIRDADGRVDYLLKDPRLDQEQREFLTKFQQGYNDGRRH